METKELESFMQHAGIPALRKMYEKALQQSGCTGYYLTSNAPTVSRKAMAREFAKGGQYPIEYAGVLGSVWGEYNAMFRLVHDWAHVRHGASTRLQDEVLLGAIQAREFGSVSGLREGDRKTLERIVWLDVSGQSLEYAHTGQFVSNQYQFIAERMQ